MFSGTAFAFILTLRQTYIYDVVVQTGDDHTVDGTDCFVTGNGGGTGAGDDDIDNGYTILYSPVYDLSGLNDALLTYWKWYSNNLGAAPNSDFWHVEVSSDGGSTWSTLEYTTESTSNWTRMRFLLGSYIELSSQVIKWMWLILKKIIIFV